MADPVAPTLVKAAAGDWTEEITSRHFRELREERVPIKDVRTVYCSGALFCPEEVKAMEEIARALEGAGYSTYLPHRDGVEAFVLNAVNHPLANLLVFLFRPITRFLSRATFALDIFQILDCDYFVFNINGRVPDEGGVVETGVAFAAGKPVVIYRNDMHGALGRNGNPVLMGASGTFETIDSVEGIPAALESLEERLRPLGKNAYGVDGAPPFVRRVARFGKKVHRVLRMASFLKPKNMMSA
ncbi:MAG: nucleoside 2-deoxyribosyltransferase [Actinomycetia bacterium]|nr:nucleoside 2-deoxyribosyltransferase [Actinomycetes bacterium]